MIRSCPACHAQNRIPLARLADAGKCGRCKSPLGPLAEPLDVGADEFRQIASAVKVPILVDFWAAWCGPCRMAAPEVKRLAEVMRGQAVVLKVDTEKNPDIASEYQVRAIPYFAVLAGGQLVHQQAGLVRYQEMERWLREAGAGGPAASTPAS